MAGRQLEATEKIRRTLERAPQLHPFIISNVQRTGRELGRGSYGSVEMLKINGAQRAGKKFHDSLIDHGSRDEGAQRMVDKYYEECRLLSNLQHPNVVKFWGICFLPDSQLPVLVTELLTGNLHNHLESTRDIPLPDKRSILQNVCNGLEYLHSHDPVIIHRDLSATNILLTKSKTAKIADLGNSRIVDISTSQLFTPLPGNPVYMPPEAFGTSCQYSTSLDMFSFGVVALFTTTQVFPKDILPQKYIDRGKAKARTEIERRETYIGILHKKFPKRHPLTMLIEKCLADEAVERPTVVQALERIEDIMVSSIVMSLHASLKSIEFVFHINCVMMNLHIT